VHRLPRRRAPRPTRLIPVGGEEAIPIIPASELKVLVGVYGITEANKKVAKFDAGLKALASSDPTVTLHAEVDTGGFVEFEALKAAAADPATTMLRAEIEDLGFEEAGIKKAIFEDPATTRLRAEIDDLGFEEGALKKHIFEEEATTHLRAEATGFDTVIAQMDAVRTMAAAPIVQEVKLQIDKSSLAALAAEDAAVAASSPTVSAGEVGARASGRAAEETVLRNGPGGGRTEQDTALLAALLASIGDGGGGKGPLGTLAWGNHSPGGSGPWWMRAMMGGGKLAGAGSLGAFAGFGAEHFLFSGLGVLGSAGAGALGGGLMAGGTLATHLVGGGSDMAVSKTTIAQATELGKSYQKLQEQIALYGAHSKEAARASAALRLQEQEMGPASHAELELAKSASALGDFWNQQTTKARETSTEVLGQFVKLGHEYTPLVAHAAEQNLGIVDKGLKPLMSWLEGPEGTGIFEHLEEEFAHNLPTAMDATDQGAQFVLKTLDKASEYTGGFIHSIDEFFIKWNDPEHFAVWEGHIESLIGDFRMWEHFIKVLGTDIVDLFSQDAGSGAAIVETLTQMLERLGEWETSTEGQEELHNLFVVHKEEILALLQVIPPLISSLEPVYMTVAPPLVEAMTEILTVAAQFLHLLDETGPITRWALGLTLIGLKLGLLKGPLAILGKQLWSPFESLLAKDPLIGRFFEQQVAQTEAVTGATEGTTAAVTDLTTAYEAMGAAATAAGDQAVAAAAEASTAMEAQMSLLSEATAAETAAADAGQLSMFPMGAGLAPTAAEGAAASTGVTVAEEVGAGTGGGVLASIGSKLASGAEVVAGSVLGKVAAIAGGYFAAEFGAKAVEGLTGADLLENQNLLTALTHGFNTEHVAETEARALAGSFLREVNHALAEGGTPGALSDASHNRVRTISKQQTDAMRTEAGVLKVLQSETVTRLGDIRQMVAEGATAAAVAFGEGTPQWHKASADNMAAAIEAIKAGEKAGLITVEEGQKQISHYLREYNLLSGTDPFHIASAFTHDWAEAGQVSEKGISKALAELRKMPPVSQAIAEQTMLHQVRAFERTGQVAKGTYSRLRSAIVTELQKTREHGGAQVGQFAEEMEGSFGTLSINVAGALENIGGNVGALLEKLGAHNPLQSFTLKYLHGHGVSAGSGSKYLSEIGELPGHQVGGFTVPGASTGDRHPYMLPHGSFIMNREATAAYGLQNGGMSPAVLESGERVFPPHEVAAIGAARLEWMNAEVPRFQHGGLHGLGPQPQLQGPKGALMTLGDAAIHTGYAAAQHYLQQHGHGTSSAGGVNYMPGGGGSVAEQMWNVLHGHGYNRVGGASVIGNAGQESGLNPASVGSGGGGLLGFTTSPISLADLQAFAAAQGKPWTDVGLQMQFFLLHENGIRASVNAAPNAAAGARIFMENWEHPYEPTENLAHREEVARWAFAQGYAEGGALGLGTSSAPFDVRSVAHHPARHLTPSEKAAHLAWKWGRRMAEGGLIAEEEAARGVPNSTAATEAKKAQSERESRQTPTEVVHWAMERIGQSQPWDSEYPGEWCGDFLADDMRSHGLPVPSGYPAAANWATYGTPLGRGHMQAGAIIDYDGQHVAMAISASQMIQGNDAHGAVGTSEIVSEVGGSPITAVRWPPYSKGHGPGAGSAPVEKVPGTFMGAHTKALSFPGVPKSLHGIAKEVHHWRGELERYEHAAHAAAGRPKLQHALQANITKIQKYLRELERARVKLRKEVARKHYSRHLAKQLGKITGEEKNIELAQRAYEVAGQYAEQVVGLEPTEPMLAQLPEQAEGESEKAYEAKVRSVEEANHATELAHLHGYEAFVEGRERPAYMKVLGAEADWRNTILGAENKAAGLEANWETQIYSDDVMLARIPKHFQHIKNRVEDWKKKNPKKDLPTILGREWDAAKWEMSLLPELRFQDKELRKSLGEARQAFYPGFLKALQPPQPPLPGSGEFEQQLQEVQGIHWPAQHEHLGVAALMPPRRAGSFGGAIWDTQTAIEELGLNVAQAQGSIGSVASGGVGGAGTGSGPTAAEQEHTRLLEELLKQSNERELVAELDRKTFSAAHVLPYAGGYESGGMVAALVGEQGPEIVATRPGSYIRNASETASILSPSVTVNHYADEDRYEVELNDERVEATVNRMNRRGSRVARRGLARPGF
jgi:hypothetical protein